MREIKFRGKRLDNGEWVYGYLVKQFGVFKIYDDSKEDFGEWIYEVDPETVGQYTELPDKQSKEIYEGDKVKLECQLLGNPYDGFEGEVTFSEGSWFVDNGNDACLLWQECEDWEITGNKYDNSESLKTNNGWSDHFKKRFERMV